MKKILFFCLLNLSLAFASCQRIDTPPTDGRQTPGWHCTFSLGESAKASVGTRAFAWESGDAMGYFAGSTANGSSEIAVGSSSAPSTFTVSSASAIAAGSKIYCYYPWSSAAGSNPASVTMRIPACQVQAGDHYDADAMPQAGLPYTVAATLASGSDLDVMPMCNLGAILRFDILTSDDGLSGLPVYSVSLDSNESGLSGPFTFDLTAVKYYDASTLAISGLGGTHAETQVSALSLSATAQSVWMVVAPGTFSGTVKVMTKRGIYAFPLPSRTFSRNTVKPFTLDLANASGVWLRKVETVAGSGTAGSADGIGTAATLNVPQGITPGPDGRLWFTQRNGRYSIRGLDLTSGQVTTIAHMETEGCGFISKHPWNGCSDGNGDYWFCLKSATAAPLLGRIDGQSLAVTAISEIDIPGTLAEGSYTTDQMAVQFDDEGLMYVMWRKAASAGGSLIRQYDGTSLKNQWTVPAYLGTMARSHDKTWMIAGSEAATAGQSYLFRIGKDGSNAILAGTGSGHTAGTFTDGDAGNPRSATLGLIEGIWMDGNGWIWWSESNADYAHIRVLIPGEEGDYARGTVHTMAGIPYTTGAVRSTADLATLTRSNGICGYGDDLYVCEGAAGNRIARIFLEMQ